MPLQAVAGSIDSTSHACTKQLFPRMQAGRTAVHLAAFNGSERCLRRVLHAGADVDTRDKVCPAPAGAGGLCHAHTSPRLKTCTPTHRKRLHNICLAPRQHQDVPPCFHSINSHMDPCLCSRMFCM